jgi:hypothetical protein
MENFNNNRNIEHKSSKVWAGLFIIAIGGLLLLNNIGLDMPNWIFRWHTFLMALGLFIGFKHNFRNSGWLVMFLIGAYFTLDRAVPDLNMSHVVFPLMLVTLGVFLIFKPKSNYRHKGKWKNFSETESFTDYTAVDADTESATKQKKTNSNDYVESVNVFGGSHQAVYSKNFKGGEITAVFGGCDLNLTQADFEGVIEIEVTAIFGGAKIIIHPGWEVKSEITSIFGGLDDKRSIQPITDGTNKLVVIKGIALFGGIDIRNY